jgi:hypothetical protein
MARGCRFRLCSVCGSMNNCMFSEFAANMQWRGPHCGLLVLVIEHGRGAFSISVRFQQTARPRMTFKDSVTWVKRYRRTGLCHEAGGPRMPVMQLVPGVVSDW